MHRSGCLPFIRVRAWSAIRLPASFDQSYRQSEQLSQTRFLALHLPIVMFVIVSGEVEHRM
jgi:hypothetical protein